MKVKTYYCPNCGVSVEPNNKFCSRCGSALVFEDDVIKIKADVTYRKIDEARLHEAESKERIRMRELDEEREKRKEKNERFSSCSEGCLAAVLTPIILLVFLFLWITGFFNN